MKIDELSPTQSFALRHLGPRPHEIQKILREIGFDSLEQLCQDAVPKKIQSKRDLNLPAALSERECLAELRQISKENEVYRSFIGMGYYSSFTPPVIQRNILENPGWYTQYTPYQAEIAQGRLEALLNFQTMICELTGFPVANASLLDEATAAAEAMALAWNSRANAGSNRFFISSQCHPQTIAVCSTRAEPLGIEIVLGDHSKIDLAQNFFGALIQYPATDGSVLSYESFIAIAKKSNVVVTVATDLLALVLLKTPAELGAQIAIGNSQRFGVPMGFGGPHAAFIATQDEFTRKIPGRIVGVSKDAEGRPAIRLALQTREQHIRREKATSNICTAQVLLAIMASMYAVYHGPEGLKQIASDCHAKAKALAEGLRQMGFSILAGSFFDTVKVSIDGKNAERILDRSKSRKINLRRLDSITMTISLDEMTTLTDIDDLFWVFSEKDAVSVKASELIHSQTSFEIDRSLIRKSDFLKQDVFNTHHSETEMLRYLKRLESKDLSLAVAMIPLGSCTMKLNATAEMFPVSWPEFSSMHPFAPSEQTQGYVKMITQLENMLAELTGFDAVSVQPNAGSQGEYAGLLIIRKYHQARGQVHRKICLIPKSAHGTNPASAVMAGLEVKPIACDEDGNIDLSDLRLRAEEYKDQLAALMVTYPSTHGVFEESIQEICEIVHKNGGQVYMDGANMNAQIGLCYPGHYGPDVCHLNLHKTFAIPHGGGGPGVGPVCVKKHLAEFLPSHPVVDLNRPRGIGAISAAPWGSPGVLPISWSYIRMLGAEGLTLSTQVAILNANYVAKKLEPHFPVLYKGKTGLVAHECIIDLRPLKKDSGVDVEDVAKRLMDYGFHAPTISFPVAGTMMIEPTESEGKAELDRFCEAMIQIRKEIDQIASGKWDKKNNPLKNAPHTASQLVAETWNRPYSRETAVFPTPWQKAHKFWPAVARIDNVQGDRTLICTCPDWLEG